VFVTVVYLDAQPKQVRIGLMMDWLDRVKDLRQKLAEDTGIPAKQVNMDFYLYFCEGKFQLRLGLEPATCGNTA
jgi:hypothetical protein